MWIRKRFDVSDRELAWAAGRCLFLSSGQSAEKRLCEVWPTPEILPVLSVRSGLDLLFQTVRWPAGSQIIYSGLTIPDMPRIAREHGLEVVGVDLDPRNLAPDLSEVTAAITPRTRAILVAHLFGGLCDLSGISALARQQNLMLLEDCAQAWIGDGQGGDSRADVSLFSFGPIKTNTSLAGGVMEVRDPGLLQALRELHVSWPRQSRGQFLRRIGKYAVLKRAASRTGLSLIARLARWSGGDHDRWVAGAARGFPGPDFFRKIRRQPAVPLLELMARRLASYPPALTAARKSYGDELAARLSSRFPVPGLASLRQTWWVLPILVDQPSKLVQRLWAAGFDATCSCSMKPIGETGLVRIREMLDQLVFLPFDLTMPPSEMERMVRVILDSGFGPPENSATGQAIGSAMEVPRPFPVSETGLVREPEAA